MSTEDRDERVSKLAIKMSALRAPPSKHFDLETVTGRVKDQYNRLGKRKTSYYINHQMWEKRPTIYQADIDKSYLSKIAKFRKELCERNLELICGASDIRPSRFYMPPPEMTITTVNIFID
ncbi:hypothetical protein DPMN_101746 [Dreissena polymorpha]|uniref:Uncharacterized protein n=1 Tax=Dreissena polymorpha TaxID=45954 RepID=A0A9D4LJP7_DREPO|nr:hypothetical protein DPMN_101746 [Dreissena polymorpha]